MGHGVVRQLFMDGPSARLSRIVLWVPILEGDDAAAAAQQAGLWSENRVQQWWDGSKEMSGLFLRGRRIALPTSIL